MFSLVVLIAGLTMIRASAQNQQGSYNSNEFNSNRFYQNQFNQNQFNNQNQYNRQPLQERQQNFVQQPQQRNSVPITSYQNDVNTDGSYQFGYASGDGSQQQARGFLKNLGQKDVEAQVVQGSYSYTSPDGSLITVTYIADENGFRADGAHLPTPPPIPEAIAKSLQYHLNRTPAQQQHQQQQQSNKNAFNQNYQAAQQSGQYQPQQQQQQQQLDAFQNSINQNDNSGRYNPNNN